MYMYIYIYIYIYINGMSLSAYLRRGGCRASSCRRAPAARSYVLQVSVKNTPPQSKLRI